MSGISANILQISSLQTDDQINREIKEKGHLLSNIISNSYLNQIKETIEKVRTSDEAKSVEYIFFTYGIVFEIVEYNGGKNIAWINIDSMESPGLEPEFGEMFFRDDIAGTIKKKDETDDDINFFFDCLLGDEERNEITFFQQNINLIEDKYIPELQTDKKFFKHLTEIGMSTISNFLAIVKEGGDNSPVYKLTRGVEIGDIYNRGYGGKNDIYIDEVGFEILISKIVS